jgi:hypothetical protein
MRITDAMARALKLPAHVVIARDIAEQGNTSRRRSRGHAPAGRRRPGKQGDLACSSRSAPVWSMPPRWCDAVPQTATPRTATERSPPHPASHAITQEEHRHGHH